MAFIDEIRFLSSINYNAEEFANRQVTIVGTGAPGSKAGLPGWFYIDTSTTPHDRWEYIGPTDTDWILANISPTLHNHDDRYYTETEVDGIIAGLFSDFNVAVNAAQTIFVDAIPLTGLKSAKWIVTIEDAANSKVSTFEVLGLNKFGSSAEHTLYARIGDKGMQYKVDVVISGGNLNLEIENSSINNFIVYGRRTQVKI
jgi:hypothetical protein